MAKREFLQLAHEYVPKKHDIAGKWLSEKLDGMRCYWDGGITQGLPKEDVPWANMDKDERYVDTHISTGLWSRYGNVIHAPKFWLNALPRMPLDGELWFERGQGKRQKLMSIVKDLSPDHTQWNAVKFMCFDSPPYMTLFADGKINTTNYKKQFKGIIPWIQQRLIHYPMEIVPKLTWTYRTTYWMLRKHLRANPVAIAHLQHELPFSTPLAEKRLNKMLRDVVQLDGEGLMLRHPDKLYECRRSYYLLKIKKFKDQEVKVIGYVTGKVTDKGSRNLGRIGSLVVKLQNGLTCHVGGLTDAMREFATEDQSKWAEENPDTRCPDNFSSPFFPMGKIITIKYNDVSRDGIPNTATYWRDYE